MEKIACIISPRRPKEFQSECWSTEIVDGLPVLYIGIDNASKNIDNFDPTVQTYGKDVWWTFGKMERRGDYLKTVAKFKEYSLRRLADSVRYEFVDITCYTDERKKAFFKYIDSSDKKTCFVTHGASFVFIYSRKYSTVWGLSLSLCEYIGMDAKKIMGRIHRNENNTFAETSRFMDAEMRKIIGDDTHLIPVLYTYIC